MEIPRIHKFLASGTVFDAQGSTNIDYIASCNTERKIYFLLNTDGETYEYDIYDETIKSVEIIKSDVVVKSIIIDDGKVYGFTGINVKKFTNKNVIYIDNNKLITDNFYFNNKITLLQSKTPITDFIIKDNFDYIILHSKTKVSTFNKNRVLKYSLDLKDILELSKITCNHLAIDIVSEYTNSGYKKYPIIYGTTDLNGFFVKIDESGQQFTNFTLTEKINTKLPTKFNLTNYSYLREKYTQNDITFKIRFVNDFNSRDIKVIEIPISTDLFSTGKHHFVFRVNTEKGEISIIVDGILTMNALTPIGQYSLQNIVTDNILVGCTNFYNGVPLYKHLQQNNYYFIDGATISQFRIYNRFLNDNEVQMLFLNSSKVDNLVASIPVDQRNNIETIEKLFKTQIPGRKSNNININIKNSSISDEKVQKELVELINNKISSILPVNTTINNITFNEY